MLQEYELKELGIVGAATDARADVEAGLGPVFNWGWCVPRILNCVAVDGTGTALDNRCSNNSLTRKLVDGSRCVIKHSNKSDASKMG